MPRPAKKTKAQRAFEQEKARVGQILAERGEELPAKDVFDEAWLQQWNADEAILALKPRILQILLDRGEAPPTGGMTVQWLRTWDAAEDARVKAEARAEGKSPVDAAEKAEWNRLAKEQAEYDMFHGTSASSEHYPDAGSSTIGDDEDRCGSLPDDRDYLSDDDEDLLEALYSMAEQEFIQDPEELGPPQKKQKTEGQQSSAKESTTMPTGESRVRISGWKRKGNARKALAQKRAATLLEKSDFAIFEESGIGLQDDDHVLDEAEKKATVQNLPHKFRMSSDPRLGVPAAGVDDKEALERFDETARKIIRFLKIIAQEYWDLPLDAKKRTWKPMVNGMLMLLKNGSEEYLLECLLSGISDSVRSTLGKPDFTIDDLENLPGGSVDENIEKGVYVDVLRLLHGTHEIRQLYVGAAAGKFGLAQRWHQYLTRRVSRETGKHSKELMKEGSTVCLRALARYGHTPSPWLVCFAESFFMLYLGTIEDPGHRPDRGHYTEAFLNDVLYKNVKGCRRFAGLKSRIAVGLNSTWSLSQGYRWAAYAASGCKNCARKMVNRKDPRWEPAAFLSSDPTRPGENVKCRNCDEYHKRMGRDRPLREEMKLVHRKTVPTPRLCQAAKCTRELLAPHEVEIHFERYQYNDQKSPDQCPLSGKHVPRVFQHDRVLQGRCYYVCQGCLSNKMGYAYQLSGKRVNYGYTDHRKRQSSSSEAS